MILIQSHTRGISSHPVLDLLDQNAEDYNFRVIWSLIIQILIIPPYNPKHYHWMHTTRTQISIGAVQDKDILIEQSPNYSIEHSTVT